MKKIYKFFPHSNFLEVDIYFYLFCRWWKDLDFVTTLPYARDRAVECYFWTVGVYSEPQYSQARVMLAKTIAMISIVDDTFDAYGIVKELEVYTDAIQRYELLLLQFIIRDDKRRCQTRDISIDFLFIY